MANPFTTPREPSQPLMIFSHHRLTRRTTGLTFTVSFIPSNDTNSFYLPNESIICHRPSPRQSMQRNFTKELGENFQRLVPVPVFIFNILKQYLQQLRIYKFWDRPVGQSSYKQHTACTWLINVWRSPPYRHVWSECFHAPSDRGFLFLAHC